jgi:competence protein ComEC
MHWWQGHFTKDHSGTLAVTWIDVGHGTSAVLEMPNGEFWLYDAGRLGDHERSYQPIINALWHLGYSRIDRMILSHADSDHYNAIPGVAKRFFPREFTTTDSVLESNNPTVLGILDLMRAQSARVEAWQNGDRYYGRGGWDVEVLHPSAEHIDAPKWSDNAKSLCLVVRYAGRTIFLPGDLEPPGTQSLMARPPVRCDVMMAPHHGSLAAKAERLIAWAQPDWVVISGSTRAVSSRVIDTLTPETGQLLITARDHAIRVEIDPFGVLKVKQWNSSGWKEIPGLSEQTREENPL